MTRGRLHRLWVACLMLAALPGCAHFRSSVPPAVNSTPAPPVSDRSPPPTDDNAAGAGAASTGAASTGAAGTGAAGNGTTSSSASATVAPACTCADVKVKPRPKHKAKPVHKEAPPQLATAPVVAETPVGGIVDAQVRLSPVSVMSILGKRVKGAQGEDLGRVVDVLADAAGRVRIAIIDFGGFLGVGNHRIAVEWPLLRFSPDGTDPSLLLSLSLEKLRTAPEYKDNPRPQTLMEPPAPTPAPAAAPAPSVPAPLLPAPAAAPSVPAAPAAPPESKQ